MRLLPLIVLVGCTILPQDYTWEYTGAPPQEIKWIVTSKVNMYYYCGISLHKYPNLGACAQYGTPCIVISMYTEEEAKRIISGDGITLYEHEKKHCGGWSHQ